LDEIADLLGGVPADLIKIDTDGFDYKILRSGVGTLKNQRPLLFFEWDPLLWEAQGDHPLDVFTFLAQLGYSAFVFFTDTGFFQTLISGPDTPALELLSSAAAARRGIDNLYFDVLAGPPEICRRAAELNIQATRELAGRVKGWRRQQPEYWQ
jgi:hypothetical protein